MTTATDQQQNPWPEAWIEALSDAALRQTSSDAIFRRGRDYVACGAVEILEEDPLPKPALSATVQGSQTYATEVWIEGDAVHGNCDCPHAQEGWFCKHQVAAALVWRARLLSKIPGKKASIARAKRPSLHEFLRGLDAAVLADKLAQLAERDHDMAREFRQWRKTLEVSDEPSELKALITDMLSPGRSFVSWEDTDKYLRRAEGVLPLIQQTQLRDPKLAAALGLHALQQAWKAIEWVDDSDGEVGNLCMDIGAQWAQSMRACGVQPAAFGDVYLQVRLDDPFGCFDEAAVEAAMGQSAMARFRQAVATSWREAKDAMLRAKAAHADKVAGKKARAAAFDIGATQQWRLTQLERWHLVQLEESGQIDEALAVLREDMSDAHTHLQIVLFLEKHGRMREAFAQAERSYEAFPDDWRIQEALLQCYERDGWTLEALAMRRKQFDRNPGVERYHAALKACQAAGQDHVAMRQTLLDSLAAIEVRGDVSLRAEILCSESLWTQACALVQAPAVCHVGVLRQIALHLPRSQHSQAVELLLRVFAHAMQRASSPYRDELLLVADITKRMDANRRAGWLTQVRAQYKAKRNFIKGLGP